MSAVTDLPGLYYRVAAPAREPAPLRSDVAGFLVRTAKGPADHPVRLETWRQYEEVFGSHLPEVVSSYSVRGYFENGGAVAYAMRVVGQARPTPAAPAPPWRFVASSLGTWARGLEVVLQWPHGRPSLDLRVERAGHALEYLQGLQFDRLAFQDHTRLEKLAAAVAERSAFVRLDLATAGFDPQAATLVQGPLGAVRCPVTITEEEAPTREDWLHAVRLLLVVPEVALVGAPDLHSATPASLTPPHARDVLVEMIRLADAQRDRLVLIDAPGESPKVAEVLRWVETLRTETTPARSAVIYYPPIRLLDHRPGARDRYRTIPVSGHVAGMISRLDRERGAGHTPANVLLRNALDLAVEPTRAERTDLHRAHVNLLRCVPGRGLYVWGGRTLELEHPSARFVAHRRLVHRLVRAMRRVAEPLVFDVNGPEMWLLLDQAITTVLLEVHRGGALGGVRPEDAFSVRCNAHTNPPEARDLGRVLCEVDIRLAAPMEVIRLEIVLSRDGRLEVFQE